MRMEMDASDYATGGVLLMECEDGLWRPVAFLSKSLNETERNYEIHDKEMLVIIRGLENETSVRRHMFQVQDLDRSQEPGIFYEGAKVKSQTSPMGTLPVEIRLYSEVCSRNKNGESGWT